MPPIPADPTAIHPMPEHSRVVLLKPLVTSALVEVGDFSYYDDPDDPTAFETRNVLYHYGPERLVMITDLPSRGDTVVGNDVWFGHGAMVMPGVRIGHGAIISSGADPTRSRQQPRGKLTEVGAGRADAADALSAARTPMSGQRGRMTKMHVDEADTDEDLVRRLLRDQFPHWASHPVRRLNSGGTVNAIYRVGSDLTARLPLTSSGAIELRREARWLPRLAPLLPTPIPTVVAIGEPGESYPWEWSIHQWLDGDVLVEGEVRSPELLARDLADFVAAMRAVELDDAPAAHRGGSLSDADAETRSAIEELEKTDEPFDVETALVAWETALAVPAWQGPQCWIHSDLMPSNLLANPHGRLAAVLDFSTAGIGDPAVDLIPAWNLLPASARPIFREHVDTDDDMWARSRGWALSMALIQLPYYRNTNTVIAANARHVIHQVLANTPTTPGLPALEQ